MVSQDGQRPSYPGSPLSISSHSSQRNWTLVDLLSIERSILSVHAPRMLSASGAHQCYVPIL